MEPWEFYHLPHAEIVFVSGSVNQLVAAAPGENAVPSRIRQSCSAVKLVAQGKTTCLGDRQKNNVDHNRNKKAIYLPQTSELLSTVYIL